MARVNRKRVKVLPDFLQKLRFCKIDTCMYFNKSDRCNPTKYLWIFNKLGILIDICHSWFVIKCSKIIFNGGLLK